MEFFFNMQISRLHKIFLKNPRISTDSRLATKDSLFFALKGKNFNGNEYAEKAINKGCKYAIIDESKYKKNKNFILVKDCLKTLQELALFHRNTLKIPVIGITGSNGKTTSKELIYSCLSTELTTAFTKGNLNNHIGVPLSLLEINQKHKIAIIEMGANHEGEIKFLCEIANPNFGIITNIGKAHLEGFESFDGVKRTKNELFNYIRKIGGIIFLNNDDEMLRKLSTDIKSIKYGKSGDIVGEELPSSIFSELIYNGNKISSYLIGDYQFYNIMLAICVADYFNINEKNIINAIKSYYPVNNRSQVIESNSNLIILDAYNANPSSMSKMIKSFSKIDKKNKVCVLGDMAELGDYSREEHLAIVKLIKNLNLKYYFVGIEFLKLNQKNSFENIDLLKKYLKNNPLSESTILVKGSRSQKLEKIIDIL